MRVWTITIGVLLGFGISAFASPDVRLKDIAQIQGARGNQLIGYGLVVGLEGTGDSKGALFTTQSVANMLQRFGISVPAGQMKVKNIAAVMVTACDIMETGCYHVWWKRSTVSGWLGACYLRT